jgi:putative membrane protein
MKHKQSWLQLHTILTGAMMGAADLVPGISGGTVALLSGIYGRLLGAISRIDLHFFKLVFSGQIIKAWSYVDATMLVNLALGMGLSLLLLAKLISWFLLTQPLLMWSLFLGLILVASGMLLRELSQHKVLKLGWLMWGLLISIALVNMPMVNQVAGYSGWGYLWLMGAGALAISAMILPGVSGSFILLLLGVYPFLIGRLAALDVQVIVIFALGCGLGLLTFSRLISYLLRQYAGPVMSLLAGLMMGSTLKLWPWKQTLSYRLNSAGEEVPLQQENLLPWVYSQMTGQDNQLLWCLLVFAAAGLLVALFGRIKLQDLDA